MNKKYPIDIGDKFGTFTVIGSKIRANEKNRTVYVAKCECGNIVERQGSILIVGNDCRMCPIYRLIGTKNQKTTFLEYIGKSEFQCLCDCGTRFVGRPRSKSCGCHLLESHIKKAKRLEGSCFGQIKILKFLSFEPRKDSKFRYSVYLAKCRCGKRFNIRRNYIGKSKSCGCRLGANMAKGQYVGAAKYGDGQVKSAIELYLTGLYTIEEVANMTDISVGCLRDVMSGKSRRDLQPDPAVLEASPLKNKFRNPWRVVKILPDQKFNSWTTVDSHRSKNSHRYWLCRCKCGHLQSVTVTSLVNGTSKQCKHCSLEVLIAARRASKKKSPNCVK